MKKDPKNFQALKNKIKRVVCLPLKYKQTECLIKKYSKEYRKLNWQLDVQRMKDAKPIFDDRTFRGNMVWLLDKGRIDRIKEGVLTESIESEMLKREVVVQADELFWYRDFEARRRRVRKGVRTTKKFYIKPSKEIKRIYLGKYNLRQAGRIEMIKEKLMKYPFIFNPKHPYYLKQSKLRTMIKKHMMLGNLDNFNIIGYVKKVMNV